MADKSASKRLPLSYAASFTLPHNMTVQFVNEVNKWISCNGVEWTVNRLKDMKLDFIRLKAGLPMSSSWIGKRNSLPNGILGKMYFWCKAKRNNSRRFSKCIQVLNCYTWFYSSDVTPAQERKFLDGVTSTPIEIPEYLTQGVTDALKYIPSFDRKQCPKPRSLILRPISENKREPHANGRTYPEGVNTLECSLSFTRSTRIGWDIRSSYPEVFNIVEKDIVWTDDRDSDVCDYKNSVGKIGLIQEAGLKLRAVANPARVYQEALRPLGKSLYGLLDKLPWDCTHDQQKGFPVIQKHLDENLTTYCVDLSGATDYFPLELQLSVLENWYPDKKMIRLFKKLSRAPWTYGDSTIRWTKGQPLGLYPSFASFALTHGLLLFSLNGFSHDNQFFVLGDDVIILDHDLYARYMKALTDMGCPISENKSISSAVMAEFGGRLITSDLIIPQLKWRQPSDDSFMDVTRNIGLKALSLLRPRQRSVAKKLIDLPECFGGLGFNPQGLSLEKRLEKYPFIFNEDNDEEYLMSYNRKINSVNHYDRSNFPNYRKLTTSITDLDQRSLALLSAHIPLLVEYYEISGKNLWSVTSSSRLPLDIVNSQSVTSNLEQLERADRKSVV